MGQTCSNTGINTHVSALPFQADLEEGQVPFAHFSLRVLGRLRMMFDEYSLMLDQTQRGAAHLACPEL